MVDTLRCLLVEKREDGLIVRQIANRSVADLPAGDVLVRVEYSSLNYKDALAATGHPGVVSRFPHVPGIDAAGIVVESTSAKFKPGDQVIVTGFEFGACALGRLCQVRARACRLGRLFAARAHPARKHDFGNGRLYRSLVRSSDRIAGHQA